MGKLFGTDGVRGVANREKELTPELAFQLGRAGAYVLTKNCKGVPRVLVGKDSRRSGDMLEAALVAGLCSIGVYVFQAGVIPTPAVAYLVRHYKLDAGVMISASHNPMQDNGIKFFNNEGFKLQDSLEDEIESLITDTFGKDDLPRPESEGVGVINTCPFALDDYASYLVSTALGIRLDGIKVALDCANGATSEVAPLVLAKLGAEVFTLSNKPNGSNINAGCGSTHMEDLQEYVRTIGADIGLAFDGDGDRMLATDENGNLIDGDVILAICSQHMKEQGKLNELVATVMSNQGLGKFCNQENIIFHRTAVGDRYVLEKMIEDNLPLGGEQSGHLIFREYSTTGDGVLSGIRLLIVKALKKVKMSELTGIMEIFPQVLINAKVPNERKKEMFTNETIQKVQKDIEEKLADDGRILVRPSGTEPIVRVMIEGKDFEQIELWAKELVEVVEKTLG